MAQGDLGVLFNNLRGKAGSVVFARSKDGTVVKPRVHGRNPRTPAQTATRAALTKASQGYKTLTPAQVVNWQTYAGTVAKRDVRTAKAYNPNAINAFTALTSKYYLVNPTGTAPLTPPAAPFVGDSLVVTVTSGPASVIFVASAANSANTKTELLLQPLKSRNRTPQAKGYRSRQFFAFAAGALSTGVNTPSGWYYAAYRYVNTLTGQVTALVPIGYIQAT